MEAWMAFLSIMAIVAIVIVAGGIIAFIGHVIIGALDTDNVALKQAKEVIDYKQYKQIETSKQNDVEVKEEYNFAEINKAKAEQEQVLANKEEPILEVEENKELDEIENRLKQETVTEQPVEVAEEDDLDDLDSLLAEISEDVIEEQKEENEVENTLKMSDELDNYNIDDILNSLNEEETGVEELEDTDVVEVAEEVDVEEQAENTEVEEVAEEITETEKIEEVEDIEAVEEVATPVVEDKTEELNSANAEIEALKAQLAELNKKLEEAQTSNKVEVVTINMTEEECVNRLEVLEERLKNVKKDYKINLKEYKPLKKVMNDLERYQTKLRRKETVVAKKKVALYGVNNYVDIDKEKAEKLANEIELYEGLRLSVAHCEEVINANKDRFPILEHTNQILEDQIAHIEADIAATQATLAKLREQNGGDENSENGDNSNAEE